MNAAYDVAIIGAGIVGAACAYECARRGLRVVIVDRDTAGAGTTAAGMGHIVAMDDSEAQFALTRYSQRLWQELRPELPDDVEYEQCGTVWVAADDEEMQEVERKRDYYGERGVTADVLDEKRLRTLEPNLRSGMKGGLLVPEDGVLYPPCAARFLRSAHRSAEPGFCLGFGRSYRRRPRHTRGWLGDTGRVRSERGGSVGARPYSRTCDQEAEGTPGDHRTLPGICAPSVGGTRILEKRAFGEQ